MQIKSAQFVNLQKFVHAAFSFDQKGAKEKAWQKEKRRKGDFALCGARGGRCPSTPQTFEKV
ncbi:MAG: hypothetical protein IJW30_00850 [Clostridia bacterium]|nr:hypothetical protein [Clostridia bacterium]